MAWTRRGVLVGAAGVAMLPGDARAAPAYSWPLGVQLWSVNTELDGDLEGMLRQLARLGYREAETAGLHGRTPAAFRAAAMRAGLKLVSAHYAMPDLFRDSGGCIAEAKALGVDWLVASSPRPDRPLGSGDWIRAIHDAMTLDAWHANAAKLNDLARATRAAGLQLAYHNHPIEFDLYDGRRGFDVLLAETDPGLVRFELDVAWAVAGGADPVALLRAHGDRIRLLHVKGLRQRPPAGRYGTDFATGIVGEDDVIDWPAVFAEARRAGVVHAFVEQEPPHIRPILASLAACRDHLRRLAADAPRPRTTGGTP